MIIKGKKTSVDYVEVEVSVPDMVNALIGAIRCKHGLNMGDACYVNAKGEIEVWVDGHGSGFTDTHGKASKAQIRAEKMCDELGKVLKELT